MIGDKVKLVLQNYVPWWSQNAVWQEALADLGALQARVKELEKEKQGLVGSKKEPMIYILKEGQP